MSLLDEWGYTALDIAKGNGTADIVALLQKAGCPENDPVPALSACGCSACRVASVAATCCLPSCDC